MKKIKTIHKEPDCQFTTFNTDEEPTATEVYVCPVCKFDITEDVSPRANNGIIGSGYASWKLLDVRACKHCGALFMPTEYNKRSSQL